MRRRRSLRARLLPAAVVCGLVLTGLGVPVALAAGGEPVDTSTDATDTAAPSGGLSFAGDNTSLSFLDDFSGPAGAKADASRWTYQTGANWGHGQESQAYTDRADNAHLTGDGTLLLTARGERFTSWDGHTRDYTSARLISRQAVRYGDVEARIRMSGDKGAWPAFWLLGANYSQVGWPACGEIDVMESTNSLTALYGSFHGPVAGAARGASYNQGRGWLPSGGLAGGWHVYGAQWSPDAVTFSLDGVPYVSVRRADLPPGQTWALDNPQNILLNIAVGGMAGTPAPPADFAATMEVDWVRVTP